jgi:hypothetical protein
MSCDCGPTAGDCVRLLSRHLEMGLCGLVQDARSLYYLSSFLLYQFCGVICDTACKRHYIATCLTASMYEARKPVNP